MSSPPQYLKEPWHIKREIQVGHILTTLTVAISAFAYVSKLEQRIALLEQQQIQQRERDTKQDEVAKEALAVLHAQLDKMDAKLDRLIERRAP